MSGLRASTGLVRGARGVIVAGVLAALGACQVAAQSRGQGVPEEPRAPALLPAAPADSNPQPPALRPLRIAKWGALGVSAAAGIVGFVQNSRADDRFDELVELCQAEPTRCAGRTASGHYLDEEFEARFREIRSLDRRSHYSLLISQVGVATTVVLFLLDLGNARPPGDIPFVPKQAFADVGADGRWSVGFRLPAVMRSDRR